MNETITLSRAAWDTIRTVSLMAEDGRETGGIVLGVDRGFGAGLLVHRCGTPGPRAIRKRTSFQRDLTHAQDLAERAHHEEGSVWIGEWHTHLLELGEPSGKDLRTYTQLLRDASLGFSRVISLIALADQVNGWKTLRLYGWTFTGSVLRQLPVAVAIHDIHALTLIDDVERKEVT